MARVFESIGVEMNQVTYRCRDEDCCHTWRDVIAHFCPRCGSRAITVLVPSLTRR